MATPDSTSNDAPIGIVVAMDAELRHLLERYPGHPETRDGIWLDHHLVIGGVPVVAVRSGMGMVSAAAATERLINCHQPRAIVNYGCSGAHRRDVLPGDVVIGAAMVNHGKFHILTSGEEHYTGFGYDVAGEPRAAAAMAADPDLLAAAVTAARDWTPEAWPDDLWPDTIPVRAPLVHTGVVASADIWTQAHARLDALHERHGSLCEEMEAAAIAQICAMHATPFLPIKDISNNEFHAATDIAGGFGDFPTAEVGKRAAALVVRMIERLGDVDQVGR